MPTPASTSTPYCLPADLVPARADWRVLSQLLSDTQVPLASMAAVLASTTLTTLLLAASGRVEAACTTGNRYVINATRNDLAALTGASKEMLKDLVGALTLWRIYGRRTDLGLKKPDWLDLSLQDLADLEKGRLVFGLVEVAQAGRISSAVESESDVMDRDGLNVHAERLLGRRMWRDW